jgi:hypothetical protein
MVAVKDSALCATGVLPGEGWLFEVSDMRKYSKFDLLRQM